MKIGFLMVFILPILGLAQNPSGNFTKPRIIVTTDLGADPDDEQSLVRLFVSSNEFDIEGLIVSTGCWKKSQSDTRMLDKIVSAYGQVYKNLTVHADCYPTPQYLGSISVMGQTGYGLEDVGLGKDSRGSDLIIDAVDSKDSRPVWVMGWGGMNNVAQAIWKVRETRSKKELKRFLSKLRLIDILGQDDSGAWIAKHFPQVFYIRATAVYNWQPSDEYLVEHIQSHGPMGSVYPDRKWATEGDTPAFLYVFPNGLNNPERIDQGSWGGRFSFVKQAGIRSMSAVDSVSETQFDPYYMYGNVPNEPDAIRRWSKEYDNDFAARMDWTITQNYEDANHHPVAVLNGDLTLDILERSAVPGEIISLNATGSSDPDGNKLTYLWTNYKEAGTYNGSVSFEGSNEVNTVQVPVDASGKDIHIVLKVHDDGQPNLYAYRRLILHVKDTK